MADVAGASGPAVTGTRFLMVAEVHSLVVEIEGDPQTDSMNVQCRSVIPEGAVRSHPLDHSGAQPGFSSLGKVLETEPLEHAVPRAPPRKSKKQFAPASGIYSHDFRNKRAVNMTITVVRSKKPGRKMQEHSQRKKRRLLWEPLGQRHPGS